MQFELPDGDQSGKTVIKGVVDDCRPQNEGCGFSCWMTLTLPAPPHIRGLEQSFGTSKCFILDIYQRGAGFVMKAKLEVGDKIILNIPYKTCFVLPRTKQIECEICWRRGLTSEDGKEVYRYQYGAEFSKPFPLRWHERFG